MKPLAFLILMSASFLAPTAAQAAGGVWCDAEDKNLSFHFEAASSRDGTGDWFNISGSLEARGTNLPADLAKFTIADANLSEHWWDNKDVRLKIDKIGTEAQGFAAVQLTSIAIAVEEADYRGRYDLRITLADSTIIHKDGAVTCSAD
jgi:hypothetical protein